MKKLDLGIWSQRVARTERFHAQWKWSSISRGI